MSDIVIKVEQLGKSYLIGHQADEGRYLTLRDMLVHNVRMLWTKTKDVARGKPIVQGDTFEEVWALRDVNFEVRQGDTVGIIGRNGAGKSTLLKILSRITSPSTGRATIRGRIACLLEVGTGFHPELTGRENIYLNGTILGMTRKEIKRKFDEIVAFAEVEKFLDTPVKRYSSGMYVRLAFAVAAHLEPEILVVDEVLAVGDAAFQKKCLGKMADVATEGRTVLFVSHNMAAVQRLCRTGLLLHEGRVKCFGDTSTAINQYVREIQSIQTINLAERRDRQGSQWLKFTRVGVFDRAGNEQTQIISGQDVFIRFYYDSERVVRGAAAEIAFNVRSSQGHLLTNLNSGDVNKSVMDIHAEGFMQCNWPRFNLRSGSYDCALFLSVNGEIVDWLQSAFALEVEDGDFFGTGRVMNRDQGDVLIPYDWSSHPSGTNGV